MRWITAAALLAACSTSSVELAAPAFESPRLPAEPVDAAEDPDEPSRAPVPEPPVEEAECIAPALTPPSAAALAEQSEDRAMRPSLAYRIRNEGPCHYEGLWQDGAVVGRLQIEAREGWRPIGDSCAFGWRPFTLEPGAEEPAGNAGQSPFGGLPPARYRFVVQLTERESGDALEVEHLFEVAR